MSHAIDLLGMKANGVARATHSKGKLIIKVAFCLLCPGTKIDFSLSIC